MKRCLSQRRPVRLNSVRSYLTRELERPFRTACALQITKYGHIRAENTLSCEPSRRHLTF